MLSALTFIGPLCMSVCTSSLRQLTCNKHPTNCKARWLENAYSRPLLSVFGGLFPLK